MFCLKLLILLLMALWLANPELKKCELKNPSKKNPPLNLDRYDLGLTVNAILQISKQYKGLKQTNEQTNRRKSREDKRLLIFMPFLPVKRTK